MRNKTNTSDGFDPVSSLTWPAALTAEQVAAIYQRTPESVREAVTRRRFIPAPILNPLPPRGRYAKPLRWRRADVLRHLEGEQGMKRSA